MDRIVLTGVRASGRHGVLDFEHERAQQFIVDATLHLDLTAGSGALLHYQPAKGLFGGGREETVARLKNVFGLYSVSPVIECPRDGKLEDIADACEKVLRSSLPQGGTFKIESRRSDKTFPLTSPELSTCPWNSRATCPASPWRTD